MKLKHRNCRGWWRYGEIANMIVKKKQSCNGSGYSVNGGDTSGVTLQV